MNYKAKVLTYKSLTKEQWEVANEVFQAYSCCPMTGRYGKVNDVFKEAGSEYALNRNRVQMEMMYLIAICEKLKLPITSDENAKLANIASEFGMLDHLKIKDIEKTTNHDVKAVEYFIREKLEELGMDYLIPYVHIGLTSEDTNNIAYSQSMKECVDIWVEKAEELTEKLRKLAVETKSIPMMGHTHGQPATPLTFGHAIACEWSRFRKVLNEIESLTLDIKLKGAVGNMAAMCFAYPDVDWSNFDQEFIEQNKELSDYGINFLPTQIESHDSMIRILDEVRHFTNLVSHVGRDDFWQYIMLKYVKQIPKENEVGSSTMPQKVNPTNAENAWANGETTASQAIGITQKLTVSIMQRDLSDSSTLRTIPMVFLHSYQAISEIIKLLGKIEVNEEEMRKDLDENPEIIAEAIQTVLRKNGYKDAYEIMKKLTRGKKVTLLEIHEFARNLEINSEDKQRLLELTPREYIGLSEQLVDMYVSTVFEKSNK